MTISILARPVAPIARQDRRTTLLYKSSVPDLGLCCSKLAAPSLLGVLHNLLFQCLQTQIGTVIVRALIIGALDDGF